ncbi:MAG: hypothetical protein MUC71_10730 [Steroidobacteraceae bacterium]|nr:hypothetical protein [Steroidobacteraceae bacterium]
MAALARFGDRQWLQALAAVIVGLVLTGGAVHRSGPVEVPGPLRAFGAALGTAGCAVAGLATRETAAIMPGRPGNRG